MNKQEFEKLKPGKKIYIVELLEECDCPCCDGSCNEPEMWDAKVYGINLEQGKVVIDLAGCGYLTWWKYDMIFTRKRDAERRLRELTKKSLDAFYGKRGR